jgi:hypothetical protein
MDHVFNVEGQERDMGILAFQYKLDGSHEKDQHWEDRLYYKCLVKNIQMKDFERSDDVPFEVNKNYSKQLF